MAGDPIERNTDRPLAFRSVDRTIERRRIAYEDEIRRLIDASFELIRRTGKLEPRVGEIVAEAGLSNQAFYKHFRSKDELLLALLDEGHRMLRGYIEHQLEEKSDPLDRVRAWIAAVLEQALHPEAAPATRPFALSRARLSELFPEEVRASEAQLTALLRDCIRAAVTSGALPSADPERDAAVIYHLSMGWVERELTDPQPTAHNDAEHLIEFALHGLRRAEAAIRTEDR